jgi:glycosyltransferase involved in cell wall biosynthesis
MLPKDQWELLLIDNASAEPLVKKYDLTWHPNARHVHEQELGLTPTRLRGIREAIGEILVFVDDDNILSDNYLKEAFGIQLAMPWLGTFGGNVLPEFECEPQADLGFLLDWVGVVRVSQDKWACSETADQEFCPIGAGMILRRQVALHYFKLVNSDPIRRNLDRIGSSLLCHGDTDMALCACDLGLATGRFKNLNINHLIPKKRMSKEYLLDLVEAFAYSHWMLKFVRTGKIVQVVEPTTPCRSEIIFKNYKKIRSIWLNQIPQKSLQEEFNESWNKGTKKAASFLSENCTITKQ